VAKFFHLATNKKGAAISKGIFLGKIPQSHHIWKEKKVDIAIFRTIGSFMPPVYKGGFFLNLVFSLTCSQIWLSPLVDDRHSIYITKIEKNPRKIKIKSNAP
jgi:hypothetical protein